MDVLGKRYTKDRLLGALGQVLPPADRSRAAGSLLASQARADASSSFFCEMHR